MPQNMKKSIIIFAVLSASVLPNVSGQMPDTVVQFPLQQQRAFQVGEEISYRIHYGLVNAGKATIKVKEIRKVNGHKVYHLWGYGRTTGMTDWFFRTRDQYETFVDVTTLEPIKFIRDVDEGGYIIKRNIDFNRETNTAIDHDLEIDTVFDVPDHVQDIFSAFYFARNLDVSAIQPGEVIHIPVFLDHEIFPFRIKFVKRETIKTKFGKIKCLRFVPVVQQGRVFKDEDDLFLWISDDANHVPIRIKSELLVGSIKADISDFKGLRHKLDFK
jgi:hypothetical protein